VIKVIIATIIIVSFIIVQEMQNRRFYRSLPLYSLSKSRVYCIRKTIDVNDRTWFNMQMENIKGISSPIHEFLESVKSYRNSKKHEPIRALIESSIKELYRLINNIEFVPFEERDQYYYDQIHNIQYHLERIETMLDKIWQEEYSR
jgi:uncharacterized protein YqgV (UPF0045/DUF77 family)